MHHHRISVLRHHLMAPRRLLIRRYSVWSSPSADNREGDIGGVLAARGCGFYCDLDDQRCVAALLCHGDPPALQYRRLTQLTRGSLFINRIYTSVSRGCDRTTSSVVELMRLLYRGIGRQIYRHGPLPECHPVSPCGLFSYSSTSTPSHR